MIKFTSPLIRTFACVTLAGSLALAAPVYAQTSDTDQAPQTQSSNDTASPTGMGKHHDKMAEVESRIAMLHSKLMITADQENDWNAFAQVMRDNEANIHQLIEERHANPESMTAIDDLQSYQKIVQAHADGAQKLTDSFKTVYNDMTDDQKKNADAIFSHFEGHGHHGMKKPTKKSS